jgi:hypothetical protein
MWVRPGFAGLNSHRATTTAEVREVELSAADALEAVRSSLEQSGWDPADAPETVAGLLEIAEKFPVGTVVERRLYDLVERRS